MAMFAAMAAMAGQQIAGGIAANREAKYNAGLYERQASMIENQKGLEAYQYDRAKRQMVGAIATRTAKSGLMLSGSPLAVMIDDLTQMELDKSIGQYNYEVQKRYSMSAAEEYKRKGKAAMTSGFSNAFSTLLMGGFDYGMRSGIFSPKIPTGTMQSRLQGRTSTFGGQTVRF